MKTLTLPNSLMQKLAPRVPDATPNEVLWGAQFTTQKATERLTAVLESLDSEQAKRALSEILAESPGVVEGSIRERIVGLRALADYYDECAERLEQGQPVN